MRLPFKLGFALSITVGSALSLLCALPIAWAEESAALTANHPDTVGAIAAPEAASSSRLLKMEIYLAPRNQAQLDELTQEQQDPTSSQYHHWLTPAQFNQRFGPT